MGNVVGSVSSGFAQVLDKILGHPLDFLSGKNCDSVCAPTWDFICYVENFCVSHLLKLIMVATLVYFLLLFLFLVYKLGVCQCICRTTCGSIFACFAACFSSIDFCCTYLCLKLQSVKRKDRRRRRDIEEFTPPGSTSEQEDGDHSSQDSSKFEQRGSSEHRRSHERRNYRHEHLRRSLRPTSHRARLELANRSSIHLHGKMIPDYVSDPTSHFHHHVHVARSSRFSHKGSRHSTREQHLRRRG